jgi:hypothetical protein
MNENQSIVLEWLKNSFSLMDEAPILIFAEFGWKHFGDELPEDVGKAYQAMGKKEDLELLKEFVEWALTEFEEE